MEKATSQMQALEAIKPGEFVTYTEIQSLGADRYCLFVEDNDKHSHKIRFKHVVNLDKKKLYNVNCEPLVLEYEQHPEYDIKIAEHDEVKALLDEMRRVGHVL